MQSGCSQYLAAGSKLVIGLVSGRFTEADLCLTGSGEYAWLECLGRLLGLCKTGEGITKPVVLEAPNCKCLLLSAGTVPFAASVLHASHPAATAGCAWSITCTCTCNQLFASILENLLNPKPHILYRSETPRPGHSERCCFEHVRRPGRPNNFEHVQCPKILRQAL